jgi:hypothetical protein
MKLTLLALFAAAVTASSLTARHICVDPPPPGEVSPQGAVPVHQAWTQGCCGGGRKSRLTRRSDASVADCMGGASSFIVCCQGLGGVPVRL